MDVGKGREQDAEAFIRGKTVFTYPAINDRQQPYANYT
jgi:hypothetical protein